MKKLKTKYVTLITVLAVFGLIAPNTAIAQADNSKHGYVSVNGLDYYYEIHGEGEPLLLLHGGLGSIEMFGPMLPMLTESRQVVGVDLHGHGRTALGDRKISLVDMGDDMAAILKELGYDKVDVLGYSMGSGVGFRLAVQHPEIVRRLVLVSAAFARDGYYPEILQQQAQVGAAMAEAMKATPMYQSYVKIAPNPEDVQRILEKIRQIIQKAAPGAVEIISYGMLTFNLNGRYLVYFAAWKNHISLYPIPLGNEAFQKEISPYLSGKGTARFSLNKPVPYDLVKKIVSYLMKENLERADKKKLT